MSESKMNFELNAQQLKYRDILNKEFLEMEIYCISDIDPNRNKTHFTLQAMEKALPGCKNKPIVGFFANNDFVDHVGKAEYDADMKKVFWNTENGERVLGVIRESDPIEIVEKDNLHWIRVRCVLFVQYCYKQIKRLLRDKTKKVSVEITVKDSVIREDGIEEILDFSLNGITILGSKNGKPVIEAIPDAHASILEQIDEDVLEQQKKMLSFAYLQMEDGHKDINDGGKEDEKKMEHRELEEKIWDRLSEKKIEDCDEWWGGCKYRVEKIYDDHIVVVDNEDKHMYKFLYYINGDDVTIDWESIKDLREVEDAMKDALENYAVDAEDVASGNDIVIDKSKDSVSEKAWGSVDKAHLKESVIKAGNFKEIANDIFLKLEEGWENGEVSKLKYPVMEVSGDKAVYNKYALAYAKAYAAQNEDEEVIEKINNIYADLDMNEDNGDQDYTDNDNAEENHPEENGEDAQFAEENHPEKNGEDAQFAEENANSGEGENDGENCSDAHCEEIDYVAKCAELQEMCDNYVTQVNDLNCKLEALSAELEAEKAKASDMEAKYSDYDELKQRVEAAEKTVWDHFCDNMKRLAIEKIGNAEISAEDKEKLCNCAANGEYKTEDDLDREVAYVLYKNRKPENKTSWEHFSTVIIHGSNENNTDNQNLTREERLARMANKNKK